MNKSEKNEVNKKCMMSGCGFCCHPEIVQVRQEIVCNGTPTEIEYCPMFSRTIQSEVDLSASDIEQIVRMLEIGKGLWTDYLKSEEQKQDRTIGKVYEAGTKLWKDYVEYIHKEKQSLKN